jgi:hypothetical protein
MPRVIILLAAIAALVSAAEHPEWPALEKLFGEDSQSQVMKDFAAKYELREHTKGPSGGFSPEHQAYSLLYDGGRIGTIIIKLSQWRGTVETQDWQTYSQPVPGGLSSGDDRNAVERKLGQPRKAGGEVWEHGGLELWIHFKEGGVSIDSIYIKKIAHGR